jgi:phospholipid/cholesterol/gamma-HCH transport system ATP-binding protein
MTVAENVGFPLRMFDTHFTESQIQKRVKECLERVNLHNVENKYPSELSGGMKKRVGIARAIALNPKYLFCDEPNSGLDPQTSSIIDKLILDLTNEYKTTTVVISHDMNSVLNIGDKIMFIYQGRKEWEGHKTQMLHSDSQPLKDFLFASELIVNQYQFELQKR